MPFVLLQYRIGLTTIITEQESIKGSASKSFQSERKLQRLIQEIELVK